ncbi:MAG: hypothetical protein AVDCRST_MAG53-2045, partial [uncultured Solirubrobacteraceae bacterium]
ARAHHPKPADHRAGLPVARSDRRRGPPRRVRVQGRRPRDGSSARGPRGPLRFPEGRLGCPDRAGAYRRAPGLPGQGGPRGTPDRRSGRRRGRHRAAAAQLRPPGGAARRADRGPGL